MPRVTPEAPESSDDVVDSPTRWVAKHTRAYVASGGTDGHLFHGVPSLLLTTRGRRSGKLRRTPLYYGRDGDAFVLVASNGGAPEHPLWYQNLVADPAVHLQVGTEHHEGRARTATPEESPRLWELMDGVFGQYAGYRRKAPREIPLVVIDVEPAGD